MDDKQKFARNLKRIRKAKNLTQEQLAELIDRSPEAVSHLERGISQPNLDTILNIRNALKVPITEFIEPIKGEQPSEPKREELLNDLSSVLANFDEHKIKAVIENAKIIGNLK